MIEVLKEEMNKSLKEIQKNKQWKEMKSSRPEHRNRINRENLNLNGGISEHKNFKNSNMDYRGRLCQQNARNRRENLRH